MRLVLASNNAKKLSELRAMLAGLPVQLVAQGELGITEAEEPHRTFIENALVKARHAAAASGGAAVADDSGLCVDALEGAPGVISAHYASLPASLPTSMPAAMSASAPPAASLPARPDISDREALRRLQDAANNDRLLQALDHHDDRRAMFVSTLVALRHADDPQPLVAVGRWPGEILREPRGNQGFGYDPLMFIPELDRTVAELDAETKNRHSHRARAMAQLMALLREAWAL